MAEISNCGIPLTAASSLVVVIVFIVIITVIFQWQFALQQGNVYVLQLIGDVQIELWSKRRYEGNQTRTSSRLAFDKYLTSLTELCNQCRSQ